LFPPDLLLKKGFSAPDDFSVLNPLLFYWDNREEGNKAYTQVCHDIGASVNKASYAAISHNG